MSPQSCSEKSLKVGNKYYFDHLPVHFYGGKINRHYVFCRKTLIPITDDFYLGSQRTDISIILVPAQKFHLSGRTIALERNQRHDTLNFIDYENEQGLLEAIKQEYQSAISAALRG